MVLATSISSGRSTLWDSEKASCSIATSSQCVSAVTWTVGDLAQGAKILAQPPISTQFADEYEMRRVYTLVYDVFRYKSVLNKALINGEFFTLFPELKMQSALVWLLFYDLYHRHFKKRETQDAALAQCLLVEAQVWPIELKLWKMRTKLAASVARLRIEHRALSLSSLLPKNLQDEKLLEKKANAAVTCWVNVRKFKNFEQALREVEATLCITQLMVDADSSEIILEPDHFQVDPHCPQTIVFHVSLRPRIAKSELVTSHKLIMQDKSFCLGPASFGRILYDLDLCGNVIQTHVSSPRSTAYLASLLDQSDRIKKLIIFSAGKRKAEYDTYFKMLGMKNVITFSEHLNEYSLDNKLLDEVSAVYVTPPNSYSAVNDPIDLVCSRGGDLNMLETLTESENTHQSRKRAARLLREQKKTLNFAMSRPQIQFVLYETHSEISAENDKMIQSTIDEINAQTKMHHAILQGLVRPNNLDENSVFNVTISTHSDDKHSMSNTTCDSDISSILDSVDVPSTDIFDLVALPDLCADGCLDLCKEGCYLACVQRKQVCRMDNKFMIRMAENRGLFGSTTSSDKSNKQLRKKAQLLDPKQCATPKQSGRKSLELARICAPTYTFLRHSRPSQEVMMCSHLRVDCCGAKKAKPLYRQWWCETARHLKRVKNSLVRRQMIPSAKMKNDLRKTVVNTLARNACKIDEIVARYGAKPGTIPLFPRLRLTREPIKLEKILLPLPIRHLDLPSYMHLRFS